MPAADATVSCKDSVCQPRPVKRIKLIVTNMVGFVKLHAESLSHWECIVLENRLAMNSL